MTKPFLLEPRKVAAAVRKAHSERRLGYQRGQDRCRYDYGDGSYCPIGAAVPRGIIPGELNAMCFAALCDRQILATKCMRDRSLMNALQARHDGLCPPTDRGAEERFFRALEACEAA